MTTPNTIRDHATNRPTPSLELKNRFFLDADTNMLSICTEKEPTDGTLVYEWDDIPSYRDHDRTWQRRLAPIDNRAGI